MQSCTATAAEPSRRSHGVVVHPAHGEPTMTRSVPGSRIFHGRSRLLQHHRTNAQGRRASNTPRIWPGSSRSGRHTPEGRRSASPRQIQGLAPARPFSPAAAQTLDSSSSPDVLEHAFSVLTLLRKDLQRTDVA